jgi:hypothetical protein
MLTLSILRSEYPANCKGNVPAHAGGAGHQRRVPPTQRRAGESAGMLSRSTSTGDDDRYGGDETDRDVITAAVAITAFRNPAAPAMSIATPAVPHHIKRVRARRARQLAPIQLAPMESRATRRRRCRSGWSC